MDVSTGDQLEILGRLVLAGLLGGFIGLEREVRGYPAGIRTLALVALGACLFTDISSLLGGDDRVAAQIVTGIGFLGAGVIFREGYTVRGITTAATIWSAAAMGMAIGIELYVVGYLAPSSSSSCSRRGPSHAASTTSSDAWEATWKSTTATTIRYATKCNPSPNPNGKTKNR